MSEDEFFRLRGLDATLYCRIMRGCRTSHSPTRLRIPVTVSCSVFLSNSCDNYAAYTPTHPYPLQHNGRCTQVTPSSIHLLTDRHVGDPLFPAACCPFLLDRDNLDHHHPLVCSRSIPVSRSEHPISDHPKHRS